MLEELNQLSSAPMPLTFAQPLSIQPLKEQCQYIFEHGEHVCLGISPFNSLFSEEYIYQLISLAKSHFQSFHLFLPDAPTLFTLEAMGYSTEDARKKMKKQINWLRNKIHKALAAHGVTNPADYILDWESLSQNAIYQEELMKVTFLFETDDSFREICLNGSRWVLQNKLEEQEISQESLLKAVKYLLAEMPLFASTNKIVGTDTSLFCYHQSIDLHHDLYDHALSYLPTMGQGYGILSAQ